MKPEDIKKAEELSKKLKKISPSSPKKIVPPKKDLSFIKNLSGVDVMKMKVGDPGRDGKDGSPDSPMEIANKLNTLEGVVDAKVIRGLPDLTEVEDKISKTNKRIDTSDLRWHGGGLSIVSHDSTLTGTGTSSSPLSVVGGGSGITSINTDTTAAQTLATGTSGTDFAVADNGTGTHTFNLPTASHTNRGALSSADWDTFNGKQAAGSYITALTGDVTASGPGSVAATLATVNSNVGTFGSSAKASVVTVTAKGLVTAASETTVTPAVGSITGLGTGVATFLATPSSANLATAVTDETGSGVLVFGTSPTITTANLSGAQVLQENASIQLDPALSADGKWTGITLVGTAGATVSFGDLLYLASSGKWLKAKADAASTSGGVLLGFALGSSTDTNPVTLLITGNIRADTAFPTFTVGAPVYISAATAGLVTASQPSSTDQVIRVVGFATGTDDIVFNPSPDYITHV